ncbi:MAG TPA: SulP family inorganic anion transporter [Gemmataceae bacterium]|nr:SulP family inorganic anion transporter [Gemmataceae bacterium]
MSIPATSEIPLPSEKNGNDETPAAPPKGFREAFFRFVPAFDSLRHYSLRSLRCDLFAGLTVAAVAVPQAMAYASIVGLPPHYGLYTAIVMTAVGALFDSSRQLINGPTNAISIAVFSAVAFLPAGERLPAAVLMALLVGLVQTGITLLRLGDLTRYVSHAVIVGFTLGAGVLLVLDQTKHLLGLREPHGGSDYFLLRFWHTLTEGGPIHGWTLLLGVGTIALVLLLRWVNRLIGARLLPELLLAVVVMALAVWFWGLEREGVRVVGDIPRQLPAFRLPEVEWGRVRALASSALAIALLGLLEAIAMAKAIAAQTGQKLDINQQCLSEGLANVAGSFFQCYPGSGSLTRSAINQQAGAVTQWSGVFSAVAVAVTVLLFADLAAYIPNAALAGILLVSAWRMVDRRQLLFHLRATRFDKRIVLATAFAAVAVSVEFCILIGVFLSFVLYVPRAARLHLSELTVTPERVLRERGPTDPPCDRILIYDLEGELFFGAAPALETHLTAIEKRAGVATRVVVLRVKRVRNPDAVCLALIDGFLRRLQARRITVLLCGVRPDVAWILRSTGVADRLGPKGVFHETVGPESSTLDAVRHAYDLLAGDVCATCPRRGEASQSKEILYYMI